MPLAPGPFRWQSDSDLGYQAGEYDFTDFVATELVDLDTIGAGWDLLIPDLVAMAADTLDLADTTDIDVMLFQIAVHELTPISPNFDGLDQALSDGDSLLNTAIGAAPVEAWINVTRPFLPTLDGLTLATPAVSATIYNPTGTSNVGSPAPVTTGPGASLPATVSLVNVTRAGNPNFVVGDSFTVTATGNPGDTVSASATVDGQNYSSTPFGTLDGNGQWTLTGTMGPDNVGSWQEQWFIGGNYITSFNFLVTPS